MSSPEFNADIDLSGDWSGTYEYPNGMAPVAFTASLVEAGGALSGSIEEVSALDYGAPKRMTAMLEGRRVGRAVSWLKMYEERSVRHDIAYEGEVSGDGLEIAGRWSIVGEWSGAFTMLRKPGATNARTRRARLSVS